MFINRNTSVFVGFKLFASLCIYSAHALAQAPNVPSSADPGRITDRVFKEKKQPDGQIAPIDEIFIQNKIPFSSEGFVLKDVNLSGITAFENGYFDSIISEYKNHNVDLATLNHLTQRITKIYRDAGYFLSKTYVPAQEVRDGIVEISVIEGRVGEVILNDPKGLVKNDHFDVLSGIIKKKLNHYRLCMAPA